MHRTLLFVTPSTCDPLTRDEAKTWLRLPLENHDEEPVVDILQRASRRVVEDRCGRYFFHTSCELRLDECPEDSTGVIKLPALPLVSVTSITSYSSTGGATVMSTSAYTVDTASEPGRIALTDDGEWPTDLRTIDAVVIPMTVGYSSSTEGGSTSLPDAAAPMLMAHKLMLAHLFEHREAASTGTMSEVPFGVDYLLSGLTMSEVEG